MREHDHYEYEYDDRPQDERVQESVFDDYVEDPSHEYGNEMARSAVERFLESESGDDVVSDYLRKERPLHREEMPEPESVKRAKSTPKYDNDEEYMTRLADARRERQRRREQNPEPKPAVRVNVERPRRSHPVVVQEPVTDEEWAPMAEEDFNSFRERYSEPHVMAPREPKEPNPGLGERTRAAAAPRRGTEALADGPSPLRYMLAIIAVGVLILMSFLALNNRSLRLNLERYEAYAARVGEYAANASLLQLDNYAYRAAYASIAAELEAANAQLNALNNSGEYNPYPPQDGTPARPDDEATNQPDPPAQPPAPAPVIHIVESGQILSRIALYHFGNSGQRYVDLIVAANENLTNPNDIYVGQELIIPVLE